MDKFLTKKRKADEITSQESDSKSNAAKSSTTATTTTITSSPNKEQKLDKVTFKNINQCLYDSLKEMIDKPTSNSIQDRVT